MPSAVASSWSGSTLTQNTMSRVSESDAARSQSSSADIQMTGMLGNSLQAQQAIVDMIADLRKDMDERFNKLDGITNAIKVTGAESKDLQLAAASFLNVPRKDIPKWLSMQYKKGGLTS